MLLNDIIKLKYSNVNFLRDVILQDDGQGVYIKEWNLDVPCPTEEDIAVWEIEVQEEYAFSQNRITNKPIYDELDLIDLKSIRALRANDTERLAQLEQEAAILRQQLLPVT